MKSDLSTYSSTGILPSLSSRQKLSSSGAKQEQRAIVKEVNKNTEFYIRTGQDQDLSKASNILSEFSSKQSNFLKSYKERTGLKTVGVCVHER